MYQIAAASVGQIIVHESLRGGDFELKSERRNLIFSCEYTRAFA